MDSDIQLEKVDKAEVYSFLWELKIKNCATSQ